MDTRNAWVPPCSIIDILKNKKYAIRFWFQRNRSHSQHFLMYCDKTVHYVHEEAVSFAKFVINLGCSLFMCFPGNL